MPAAEPAGLILVIGIGNRLAGDDAAGLEAARLLAGRREGAFRVVEHSGEGAGLIESWDGAAAVVLIDAARSGAEPGAVRRFDAGAEPLPAAAFRRSTHAFGVAEAVELARALGQLPPSLILYAIEGASFETGAGLSDAVAGRLPSAVEQILAEIRRLEGDRG